VRFEDPPLERSTTQEEEGRDEPDPQEQQPQPNTTNKNNNNVTLNPTINLKRSRSEDEDEPTPLDDFDPLNNDEDVKMSREVNAKFATHEDESMIGGAQITNIVGHNWIEGRLKLKAEWSIEQTTWEELKDLKEDQPPRLTTNYNVNNNVTRSQRNDRTLTWAKKVIRDLKRTARRISRL
jgi:hypothetical protein